MMPAFETPKPGAHNLIKRFALHALFWLIYLGFNTLLTGYYGSRFLTAFLIFIKPLPIIMAGTYYTNYYLVPKFLLTKKYPLFAAHFIISAIFFTTCQKIVFTEFMVWDYYRPQGVFNYFRVGFFYPTYILSNLFDLYSIVFVFGFVKVFREWYQTQQNAVKLQKEKSEAELKFLKAQLNPHFLFNVLNNLYALSLKKSDRTPDMILRLSTMMDFMLHEAGQHEINLSKEISLIEDYVELEKLRYGERLMFDMEVKGKPDELNISPLIVFPFVENSFKHGASNEIATPFIKLSIYADRELLEMNIANSKGNIAARAKGSHTEGIGLNNTRRRLELAYSGRYKLEIQDTPNIYTVKLSITF